ncbi:hypothetical protein [Nocardiopsis chromatogenes]|uniref:hypothetical protein n=1 Tax=Nocardiopsis chromatogenes TaxID=280239 RepID=UPI00034918A0|nr:hypothetical protein [Nocardiopsis chromatogenes]
MCGNHEALSAAIARHLIDHEGHTLDTDLAEHLIAAHHSRARSFVLAATAPSTVMPGSARRR